MLGLIFLQLPAEFLPVDEVVVVQVLQAYDYRRDYELRLLLFELSLAKVIAEVPAGHHLNRQVQILSVLKRVVDVRDERVPDPREDFSFKQH